MPSLEIPLSLRIGSNLVQNNAKIDKHSFLSSSEHMIPIKFTDTIQNKLKIHVAFNNNLDKNRAYAIFAKPKYGMFMLHFCKYYTNQTIRKYNKK